MKTSFNLVKPGEQEPEVPSPTLNGPNRSPHRRMMKPISVSALTKLAACAVLAMGLSASASASCGDSLAAMASGKAIVSSSIGKQLATASRSNTVTDAPIIGLWYVQFLIGGEAIQEAFQNWNAGGTEVHNPNVDPRTGNVCLGTWVRIPTGGFKLAHRVWNYDNNGNFLGTIHLSETVYVSNHGNTQTGSFKLDFYDTSGNFEMEVAGNISGQRIQVE